MKMDRSGWKKLTRMGKGFLQRDRTKMVL